MEIILNLPLLGSNENPSREQKNAFFSDCFEKLHGTIFTIAYNYCRNQQEAQDLTSDFFLKMMNWRVDTFRDHEDHLASYILKAVWNHCISECKKPRKNNQTQIPLNNDLPIPDQGIRIEKTIIDHESITALEYAISQLPEAQQQVVTLFGEGYSHKEIAKELNISPTASTSCLNRARKTLREHYDRNKQ